jgi:seryl-tRNA(Sec) selenium transferase
LKFFGQKELREREKSMGISQYKVEAKVNPQIIAAVIAAVLQYEHDEQPGEIIIEKQYIQQKNKGWKNLCLQENCWGLSRFRY